MKGMPALKGCGRCPPASIEKIRFLDLVFISKSIYGQIFHLIILIYFKY